MKNASFRTTRAGWAAILIAVVGLLGEFGLELEWLDDGTLMAVAGFVAIIVNAVGNLFARDDKVSSEEAGAGPANKGKS